MKSKLLVVPVVVVALAGGMPLTARAETGGDRNSDFAAAPSKGALGTSAKPKSADGNAKIDVMVQLSGDPVAVAEAKAGEQFDASQRNQVKAKLRKAQNAITDDIAAKGGKVLGQLQSAYNGIRVQIKASKVDSLAALPGVSGVHAITAKKLDNTVSVPFIGSETVWQNAGLTGKAVKVAIIDTGIDYTHADFGGPGTPQAYAEAKAHSAEPADSRWFGPNAPRVKGGYDFVGDDYDAGTAGKQTPKPDTNPLDCEGHGSHVAGTAAGGGVTSAGAAYTGPYDASTSDKAFKVGPGVAPQADLYALRVFGCSGTTDVVVDAIDWAVDHGMDVVNMSLGGAFGRSDDPDAVAASNAVAAGVVVIASSGNAGSSPYITGSPASGNGVVSVAAVDSTGTYPGATLAVSDGDSFQAINANGANLPAGGFKIVVVGDDPSTPSTDESLGCSTDAFARAGITPSSSAVTVAVVKRGDCARVAKAVYGQEAGASAVLMLNNADEYPPYEGTITSNPDTGADYTVTIPFLGVKSSDAAKLIADAGKTLTLQGGSLDNPSFRKVASFSSAGPVNGDSSLSPNVAAPGVSITSVAVGTGNGGTVLSGTSMAAPHVTGAAALGVQAHPTWTASQLASALVATSDPEAVTGYAVTDSGAGLVDPVQLVSTKTFVSGDSYRTKAGKVSEDSLSFGFAEPSVAFFGAKTITITNTGSVPVSYSLSQQASDQSRPATVRFSSNRVRVPAHHSVKVLVSLSASASSLGGSLTGSDQFSFRQISGDVVLNSSAGVLRVPYLLVPRAKANVIARALPDRLASAGNAVSTGATNLSVQLANPLGAVGAYADVYTWGLKDGRDVAAAAAGSGYDLRAAGVQSFDSADGKTLVFAVNNHDRWSNAATDEFDVSIDTNGDHKADYVVFSADSGAIRTGDLDGITEVFVANIATGTTSASGFLAQAPTDSSTILLPVLASDIGLSQSAGAFAYTVSSYTIEGDGSGADSFSGWASYDPWNQAYGDAGGAEVAPNRAASVAVTVNAANLAAQAPLGLMVVAVDNHSGANEAVLLNRR